MPCRCDAIGSSPQSSLTSIVPSLALLAHRRNGSSEEEQQEGDDERAPGTFSTIDEHFEEGDEARKLRIYY